MRHYKYSVLALVLILACLLSACAPKTPAPATDNTSPTSVSSEPAPQLGGEIVVATWAGDPFESAWKAKAAEFEEKTGITVVIDAVPWENLREKCVLELASNTGAYDVVYVHPSWFSEFAENGYLMPVSSYATEEEINAYVPNLVADYTVDNTIYGLPDFIGSQVLAIVSSPLIPVGYMTSNMIIIFVALGASIGAWGSIISMRRFLDA